jgi:hypothetical protein
MIIGIQQQLKRRSVSLEIPVDYQEWDARTVIPTPPVSSGTRFWHNPQGNGLLSSMNYTGAAYSIRTIGTEKLFDFYVDPLSPTPPSGQYHHRAEITRRGKSNASPLGTRELLGFGYYLPTPLLLRRAGFSLLQFHTGSSNIIATDTNYPAVYFEVAYAGVKDDWGDPAQENELVVVNKVREFELGAATHSGRKNTGLVLTHGNKYYFMVDYISGNTNISEFQGYILVRCKINSGAWVTIYEEEESTAWAQDVDGGSVSDVHPHWKLGVYAFGLKTITGVNADRTLNGGQYYINACMTPKIKNAKLLIDDAYRESTTVLNTFDPTK